MITVKVIFAFDIYHLLITFAEIITSMQKVTHLSSYIARIENFFVENAQYVLNAREQKIILHLAANLDVEKDNFHEQIIPVKRLEEMLKQSDSKWGGIYKEMAEFSDKISSKKIKFPTDVLLDGEQLSGYMTWFSTVAPCYNEHKEVCLKFRFNADLKPFLLKLNQYVKINLKEIAELNSFYSLRLFQIFKTNLSRRSKYSKIANKTYDLNELRNILGAHGKYNEFKYFNRDILAKAVDEINDKTNIFVKYESLRTKRKTTHVKFTFCEKKDYKEFQQLSFFDADPIAKPKRTPEQRKAKQALFNYEHFKKAYPLIHKQKQTEIKKQMAGRKNSKIDKTTIDRLIENACSMWFSEYA